MEYKKNVNFNLTFFILFWTNKCKKSLSKKDEINFYWSSYTLYTIDKLVNKAQKYIQEFTNSTIQLVLNSKNKPIELHKV